jgi:hypothetical protein
MADDTTTRSPFGIEPPHPELERLQPLVGGWKVEDHTPGQRARPRRAGDEHRAVRLARRRLLPRADLRHRLRRRARPEGRQLLVHDAGAGRFRIIFSNNGAFTRTDG